MVQDGFVWPKNASDRVSSQSEIFRVISGRRSLCNSSIKNGQKWLVLHISIMCVSYQHCFSSRNRQGSKLHNFCCKVLLCSALQGCQIQLFWLEIGHEKLFENTLVFTIHLKNLQWSQNFHTKTRPGYFFLRKCKEDPAGWYRDILLNATDQFPPKSAFLDGCTYRQQKLHFQYSTYIPASVHCLNSLRKASSIDHKRKSNRNSIYGLHNAYVIWAYKVIMQLIKNAISD